MARSETSDAVRGNFLDVEEGFTRQNHPKAGLDRLFKRWQTEGKQYGMQRRGGISGGCHGVGEVCQRAHMKSFSWVYRRMYVVMGGLEEHRCSRIPLTGGWMMFI